MGPLARDHGDPALLAFVGQLLNDGSLDNEAEAVARKLLEKGATELATNEIVLLEQEVIEPYIAACEACDGTPTWAEMLHVYDTGLCAACFDKLEGVDIPAVRPEWMPLPLPPADDEDTLTAIPAPASV
jgi:hypothetical protein